jgi:hypothetical protein
MKGRTDTKKMATVLDPLPPGLPARIRASVIARALNVTTQTVKNWANRGWLPPPLKINARLSLWDTEAVRVALAKLLSGGADHVA